MFTLLTHMDKLIIDEFSVTYAKKFVLGWLKQNKDVVNDFIIEEGLYNVWIRGPDTYLDCDAPVYDDNAVVATCTTLKLAEKWIVEHGRGCIEMQKENCSRFAVLTIIYQKNYDLGEVDYPTDYSHTHMISGRKYPTYAFSKKDYMEALKEHAKVFRYDWCNNIIPEWIYRVKKNDEIIRGGSMDSALGILSNYGDSDWKDMELEKCRKYYGV